MKIKSITFDCPILYRGRISFTEEIHAPEINSFVNGVTYNDSQSHLVVVDYNNSQYVIDVIKHYTNNDNCYSKQLSKLSCFLQATVSIIRVTLNENSTYLFETVQSSVYKLTGLSIEDEILHEFPKLSLISNYHIREYNANIDYYEATSCVTTNHAYFVVLPFKDKQYIIANYTRRAKAKSLINKAELHNAFIVDVECKSLCENENNIIDDSPVEDLKSLVAADLDSLI